MVFILQSATTIDKNYSESDTMNLIQVTDKVPPTINLNSCQGFLLLDILRLLSNDPEMLIH